MTRGGRSARHRAVPWPRHKPSAMLAVHEWGSPAGIPLLCLHGVMGDGGRFKRLAADRFAHRRVIAPDLRGHGASTWDPPWDIETHLDDLRALLDARGIERTDIVGFSFGARLALELAALHPDRVARIALLDPAVRLPPTEARQAADDLRTDEEFADVDAAIAARLMFMRHTPIELLRHDLTLSLEPGPNGGVRYRASRSAVVTAYSEMVSEPRLPGDIPTLLIRAEEGLVDDVQEQLLREALGHALTIVTVPGAHPVMWEAYEATADATAAHLAEPFGMR
jgi:lipase